MCSSDLIDSTEIEGSEANKEDINFTQHAYNLDHVSKMSFPANSNLSAKDIQSNKATISTFVSMTMIRH